MMTFRKFSSALKSIPAETAWHLADLGEAKGRQDLFKRQSPEKFRVLREHAMIESTVSSNRIEGIEAPKNRVRSVLFDENMIRDRNENELRRYRDALRLIHESGSRLPVSERTLLNLNRLALGRIGEAGRYKTEDGGINRRYLDGHLRNRFKAVSAARTRTVMTRLVRDWSECLDERHYHPLIALAAFNLDFLCIHPFHNGNGRVSRLILLLQCYHLGYEVGRFISLERLIEENKDRYYRALEKSSRGWHKGKHDPWPYINFLLEILKLAYREFEARMKRTRSPRGAKTELIEAVVNSFQREFTLAVLEETCPSVSRDMIRRVLCELRRAGKVICLGRGPGAFWSNKGTAS